MVVNHCGADHIVDVTNMVGIVSGPREEHMSLPDQIARYMSLREPQAESLQVLHEIADGLEFRTTSLKAVGLKASEKSRAARPVEFDTDFPSFCFALATGVGKTRLMGAWGKFRKFRKFRGQV